MTVDASHTGSVRAVIALGGNLGDRESTLRSAVGAIEALEGVHIVAASGLVETPALKLDGVDYDAPAYLNAVVIAETTLEPSALLNALASIESQHHRTREVRWGDRTLDLDLISVDGVTLDTPRLTLPHPRAHERAFVLAPWLQADADATLAGHGRVADLLQRCSDTVTPFAAAPLLPVATEGAHP